MSTGPTPTDGRNARELATLKTGGRDGRLIVVDRDLKRAVAASEVALSLQVVLDDWHGKAPKLAQLSAALNSGRAADAFDFDPNRCASPLPRAYQWADGSAYVNHVELVRKARDAQMPASFWNDPLMYQGGGQFPRPLRPYPSSERRLGPRSRRRSGRGHRRCADGRQPDRPSSTSAC